MRSRALKYKYEMQSWSVKCAPVLEQALKPETKDVATSRIAFLAWTLSLPGCFKCSEQALILSLAGTKSAEREPNWKKTPCTSSPDLAIARMSSMSFWIAIRAQIATSTAVLVIGG